MANNTKNPIEKLKTTRWWKPALRKFAAHLKASERAGCPELRERFIIFANEILITPEAARDSMLALEERSLSERAFRYTQYDSPIASEMKMGLDRGRDASTGWKRGKRREK